MTHALPAGIADFGDAQDPGTPWVGEPPAPEQLRVVPFDPAWAERAAQLRGDIRAALTDRVLALEHVGSTAVAGLAAKDVIDLDLIVADPADESGYVPELAELEYRLTVREPGFEEHRMLRLDEPRVNLHVFGPDSAEAARHRLFRDWLRRTPADLQRYAEAKQSAADHGAQTAMAYNARKHAVVREIYARIFAAHGVPLVERALAPDTLQVPPGSVDRP